MKANPKNSFPTKRLRFLTRRDVSDEQRQTLNDAAQVTFLPMENIGEQGKLDCSLSRDIDDIANGYTQFFDGDVLVAKITPCFENGKGALVRGTLNGVGFGTTELHVLRPTREIDARFLYYSTVSARFRQRGEAAMFGSAGQKRVPEEFVRNFRVSLPPLEQQCAIADFLDRKTAQLDALVEAKRRVLELLFGKRQALIARAVTRGIMPGGGDRCELEASRGVDLALASGAHGMNARIMSLFGTKRLKHVVSLRRSRVDGSDDGRPYVGLEDIASWTGTLSPDVETNLSTGGGSLSNTFEPGDVLFGKLRPYLAKVWVAEFSGRSTTECLVLQPVAIEPRFLGYVCLSCYFIDAVDAATFGSKMPRAEWEFIGNMHIPAPGRREQLAIADFLDRETAQLNALAFEIENTIALLKERRSALIAAAVTGQIEVKRAA